ncbi:MAG: Maf family protein [Acidobacteriota bacterium]
MNLVLASQSPRRRELLTNAGFPFTVRVRPVEEVRQSGEDPIAYVQRLAKSKAEAAWEDSANEVVLGADTVVVLGQEVLEKPLDVSDARRMLTQLSGHEHTVITGICLRDIQGVEVAFESTRVHFLELNAADIDAYVATGEPMDKAGAYAIQGLASRFIDRIEGCYFNVVGLPVSRVARMLETRTGI